MDWIVHHKPYGYMDRHDWLKSMWRLSKVRAPPPLNHQVLLYDGHKSHFDDRAIEILRSHPTQQFSSSMTSQGTNNQPRSNGPNSRFKALCNKAKSKWTTNFGTTSFSAADMDYILVK